MFDKARELVLGDRNAARKALLKEQKDSENAKVEAELDALADRARANEEQRALDKARRTAEAARLHELSETRKKLSSAAAKFDRAAKSLGSAFDEIETLQARVAALDAAERVDVNMRKWGYVRALWHAAAPMCRRLGLARTMGTRRDGPLADKLKPRKN